MNRPRFVWIGLIALTVVLMIATKYFPYFPGDVPVARLVQFLVPGSTDWARWVTRTAESPSDFVLLGITFILAWVISGWRASVLSIVSFAGLLLFGKWLNPLIAQPRPAHALIHVVGSPPGYAFPSILAVVYAATFGFLAVLAAVKSSGPTRLIILVSCCIILFIGAVARLVLGAHWPSDILVSYLIGFLWVSLLIRFS